MLIEIVDAERRKIGLYGRRLVEEKFTWPKVAASLKNLYDSIL